VRTAAPSRVGPREVHSLLKRRWHIRSWRDAQVAIAIAVLLTVLAAAALAPVLPLQPNKMQFDKIVSFPSERHWLGTDSFGRDIFARLIYGARVSLRVSAVAVLLAVAVGVPAGLIAGYWRGVPDLILMRVADALLAFPAILLAVSFIGILGPGETSVMLGLGIIFTPVFARIARAKTLTLRQAEYVQAAKALGASDVRVIFRHLVPNAVGPIIVQITVALAYAIIAEAGMSFLGLGTQPPTPSWGLMLAEARPYIQQSPWYPLVPGIALSVVVLNITLIGDHLRERFDPRAR
jgi:peptide/nickel transport system permease protein